jgi:hypothetical protein
MDASLDLEHDLGSKPLASALHDFRSGRRGPLRTWFLCSPRSPPRHRRVRPHEARYRAMKAQTSLRDDRRRQGRPSLSCGGCPRLASLSGSVCLLSYSSAPPSEPPAGLRLGLAVTTRTAPPGSSARTVITTTSVSTGSAVKATHATMACVLYHATTNTTAPAGSSAAVVRASTPAIMTASVRLARTATRVHASGEISPRAEPTVLGSRLASTGDPRADP